MERKKRYPAPIRSTSSEPLPFVRFLERLVRGWNTLPQYQLTRRGLMELGDEELAELGVPQRSRRN